MGMPSAFPRGGIKDRLIMIAVQHQSPTPQDLHEQ